MTTYILGPIGEEEIEILPRIIIVGVNYVLVYISFKEVDGPIDFHCRGTLSAGMASAASSATLRAGSSAHAIPAGVAPFRSNQYVHSICWMYANSIFLRRYNRK